jgi:hypothetical protein
MIDTRADDDPGFVDYVRSLIDRIVALSVPGIYVTRVDRWFGDRWIGFSGKVLGAAGVHHGEDFRVPPFVPNRIVSSRFFRRTHSRNYVEDSPPVTLHRDQRSEENLRRKLADLAPEEVLIWFTGSSGETGRGSVLAYVPTDAGHEAWFVGLAKNISWRVVKIVGIAPEELRPSRPHDLAAPSATVTPFACPPSHPIHTPTV